MVAQDVATFWDLKPNSENTNQLFNVLCNVQPVEHPRSWDWYWRNIDVLEWSRHQFWLEKCKWLKKCKLYEYECNWKCVDLVIPEDKVTPWDDRASSKKRRNEKLRANSNFTDTVIFQWYRLYMRKNDFYLNPYWEEEKKYNWQTYVDSWWDWDEDTCDHVDKKTHSRSSMNRPSEKIEQYPVDCTITDRELDDNKVNTFNTAWRIRIYAQPVDTKWCSWDSFDWPDEAPIILLKEYEAAECNPDHFVMWYWWIWTPRYISGANVYAIRYNWQIFVYIKQELKDGKPIAISPTNTLYVPDRWIYLSWLQEPDNNMQNILDQMWIELWWYMIPQSPELFSVWLTRPDIATDSKDWEYKIISTADGYDVTRIWWTWWDYKVTKLENLKLFPDFWEVPYFASGSKLYSINWFYTRNDWDCCYEEWEDWLNDKVDRSYEYDNPVACKAIDVDCTKRRVFIYDEIIEWSKNSNVITWLARRWWRLAYIAWWNLFLSWNWNMNWMFSKDGTAQFDIYRWAHTLPMWLTDLKEYMWALILIWPKNIYAVANEANLLAWSYVSWTDNDDWYYSPWSYHNDDWEFLLLRRWKVLWSLTMNIWYNSSISLWFDPETWYYVNWHIKAANNKFDIINIDADINKRYVSIYDNNPVWDHYSKLLIYDKHYKFRYRWMITWARVIHVKDNIFLWDWIYTNKWRTRWWKNDDTEWWEIIEIISAYIWEEWLQTPKHIQYVKTAIWDHSVITNDSYRDIDTSYWGKLFERRNNITSTRYPRLLFSKDKNTPIETYEIWEEIYWHWKLLSHNLLNEISEYRNYDKFSNLILRDMWEDIDMKSTLARFASIKEPINAPANVLEVCISARHLDNVQFGSFYIWYYQLDADYEDIENTNIDISDVSDRTKEYETVINRWEYCDEILEWSACDSE